LYVAFLWQLVGTKKGHYDHRQKMGWPKFSLGR
jgi:hypothetical protein